MTDREEPVATPDVVQQLIDRSNRLGADPRNTNYAGGNTSAQGRDIDPVTGEPVDLLWVKGSGGDLGTLTESGLAVLRLDRLRALVADLPCSEVTEQDCIKLAASLRGLAKVLDRHAPACVDAAPDAGGRERVFPGQQR